MKLDAKKISELIRSRKKMAAGGDVKSPTKTSTETGGSSPGGASTGGVGSGLGGAGTGGAATGGASTGGAGTITITVSGKTKVAKGAINISNVGGKTDKGTVTSGDGPGASGSGGTGKGSPGGNGAAPDEPDDSQGMAEGGEVDGDHEAIMDQVSSEVLEAIANNDKQAFKQSLEVLINNMMNKQE